MEALNTGVKSDGKKGSAPSPTPTFFRDDFPLIRGALLTLFASLIFGAGLVSGSTALLDKWRQMVAERTVENQKARQRLAEALIEQRDLIAFQPAFEKLRRSGLVGDERRLDLMEQIKSIHQSRRLLPLSYTLAPQQNLSVDAPLSSSSVDVRGTRINLHADLLHEMDLLYLLADLKGRGMYVPDSCDVKRVGDASSAALAPRLSADCALVWVTLAPRKKAAPAPAGGTSPAKLAAL